MDIDHIHNNLHLRESDKYSEKCRPKVRSDTISILTINLKRKEKEEKVKMLKTKFNLKTRFKQNMERAGGEYTSEEELQKIQTTNDSMAKKWWKGFLA